MRTTTFTLHFFCCFLQIFNIVNRVIEKAGVLQRTPFDTGSSEQVAQLERLWSSLQPSIRREAGGWGDIGFQNGERPETDFRGMGLLGEMSFTFSSFNQSYDRLYASAARTRTRDVDPENSSNVLLARWQKQQSSSNYIARVSVQPTNSGFSLPPCSSHSLSDQALESQPYEIEVSNYTCMHDTCCKSTYIHTHVVFL